MGEATLRLRTQDVAWRELDGEGVLLDLRSSTYVAINESATVLWRLLAQGTTRDALVAALVAEYGLGEEQAGADVDAFLADCRRRGLVDGYGTGT